MLLLQFQVDAVVVVLVDRVEAHAQLLLAVLALLTLADHRAELLEAQLRVPPDNFAIRSCNFSFS